MFGLIISGPYFLWGPLWATPRHLAAALDCGTCVHAPCGRPPDLGKSAKQSAIPPLCRSSWSPLLFPVLPATPASAPSVVAVLVVLHAFPLAHGCCAVC